MRNRWPVGLVALGLMLMLAGCASRQIQARAVGNKAALVRLLIATQKSEFKAAVVARLQEEFRKDAGYIKIIDLSELELETTADYSAVVIINTGKAFRARPPVRRFIGRTREPDKIVLLTTVMSRGWHPKGLYVDSITAASEIAEAGAVAEDIATGVRAILAKK